MGSSSKINQRVSASDWQKLFTGFAVAATQERQGLTTGKFRDGKRIPAKTGLAQFRFAVTLWSYEKNAPAQALDVIV